MTNPGASPRTERGSHTTGATSSGPPAAHGLSGSRAGVVLLVLGAASLAAVLSLEPIAQDPGYHRFADQRALLGMPHWQNVLSNVPFLLVGLVGLRWILASPPREAPWSWGSYFLGVALVCFGSAYYHWNPDNETLLWDRLPMTLAFMGVFVALLGEHLNPKLERYLLLPALGLGFFSVYHWTRADDLRLYIWVQAIPLITVPVLLWLFDGNYTHRRYLVYAVACYALAKVVEFTDEAVLGLTGGLIGGHAAKHLLAALGSWMLYEMLRRRKRAGTGTAPHQPGQPSPSV